jgi:hypothetical protein
MVGASVASTSIWHYFWEDDGFIDQFPSYGVIHRYSMDWLDEEERKGSGSKPPLAKQSKKSTDDKEIKSSLKMESKVGYERARERVYIYDITRKVDNAYITL